MLFPIVIHKDKDSDYGVTVPDLPGCFSAGETLEEAVANAREAIELHIEGMIDAGEAIVASAPEVHQQNPDFSGGVWHLVELNPANLRGNAQRVNITIPERVLGKIDRAALAMGHSRSEFLVRAALQFTTGRDPAPPALSRKAATGEFVTVAAARKRPANRTESMPTAGGQGHKSERR